MFDNVILGVSLKCKVGDSVYIVMYDADINSYTLKPQKVVNITIQMGEDYTINEYETSDFYFREEDYNKTWFTDFSLALKKLEEVAL